MSVAKPWIDVSPAPQTSHWLGGLPGSAFSVTIESPNAAARATVSGFNAPETAEELRLGFADASAEGSVLGLAEGSGEASTVGAGDSSTVGASVGSTVGLGLVVADGVRFSGLAAATFWTETTDTCGTTIAATIATRRIRPRSRSLVALAVAISFPMR